MKKLVRVSVAFLSTLMVVSCKGKTKEETGEFKPSLDVGTRCAIKVVGDYDNFEALEAEFDRFNEYYPNVTLSYRRFNPYASNLATKLEQEDGKNINIFFSYASYMAGGETYTSIVSHMEDLADPKLNIGIDSLRSGLVNKDKDGKVFLAPVFSRTYGTLVNNDLFEKEGIAVPSTWDELLNACALFKEKGYLSPMMGYSLGDSSCWMNTVAYPAFVAALAGNPEALEKANNLDPSAGSYMSEGLNKVKQLVDTGAVNLVQCDGNEEQGIKGITDNYKQVLLRFFKGDVPMMICTADTVSGGRKREKESAEFKENPFGYSFLPIPLTNEGGYFIDSPSVEFSVNKDCNNLDMTNEFMRFLFQKEELKNLASLKGLINSTKDEPFGAMYASFAEVPTERTFSPESLGIKDPLAKQIRLASYKVGKGELTVEQAIAHYGSLS